MYLFLAFLLVPIIEIALFIKVGGWIGLWPTLAIVVLTAIIGTALIRAQGQEMMVRAQNAFTTMSDPTEPIMHGIMIIIAGAFLMTPGFFTDAIGIALLIPPVRSLVFNYLRKVTQPSRIHPQSRTHFRSRGARFNREDIIDGEFTEVHPQNTANDPISQIRDSRRH